MPLTSLYLSDLYTTSGFRGQMRYLYIFGSIALFVLPADTLVRLLSLGCVAGMKHCAGAIDRDTLAVLVSEHT